MPVGPTSQRFEALGLTILPSVLEVADVMIVRFADVSCMLTENNRYRRRTPLLMRHRPELMLIGEAYPHLQNLLSDVLMSR